MGSGTSSRSLSIADGAGALGAIVAALCCAGTPIIVGALGALGLGFLRKDAILWPVMLGALLIALWGFWRGFRGIGRLVRWRSESRAGCHSRLASSSFTDFRRCR